MTILATIPPHRAPSKVGTHHRSPLSEYERYSRELIRRMAEVTAADVEAELFGE
ncbi:MAG: hypothetical protein Q4D96_05365 [Propionibacteriaceae bacterium]|nr:hypothetical protein [Propionibacteriaceae bacterium]